MCFRDTPCPRFHLLPLRLCKESQYCAALLILDFFSSCDIVRSWIWGSRSGGGGGACSHPLRIFTYEVIKQLLCQAQDWQPLICKAACTIIYVQILRLSWALDETICGSFRPILDTCQAITSYILYAYSKMVLHMGSLADFGLNGKLNVWQRIYLISRQGEGSVICSSKQKQRKAKSRHLGLHPHWSAYPLFSST